MVLSVMILTGQRIGVILNTKLRVRINSETSAGFVATIGSPQGDSLSPVLFTCYLAAALKSVRTNSQRADPPVSESGMPMEMTYADDVDFVEEEKAPLDQLQPVAAETLKSPYNHFMNGTKTDFTNVFLADVTEADDELEMWNRRSKIPLQTKLHLYNAICVSVMLYNCSSRAVPKAQLDKLDACHRNHLRIITGHKWPNSLISNDALYRMCKEEPLSRQVHRARWNMLGHVLRMDIESQAQKSLEFALAGCTK